jgi:hypothetical protein
MVAMVEIMVVVATAAAAGAKKLTQGIGMIGKSKGNCISLSLNS